MKIRYAIKSDAKTIAKFNSAMAMETELKPLDSDTVHKGVKQALNNKEHGFYLIAQSDGAPVGQLFITTEWSDWRNGDFWWIQSVYVTPEFRGKKVYRMLHEKVKELAKNTGNVCGIRLYVEKDNKFAQKVYDKMGMTETDYLIYEDDWSND